MCVTAKFATAQHCQEEVEASLQCGDGTSLILFTAGRTTVLADVEVLTLL